MNPGDRVTFSIRPDWVDLLPAESRQVFEACLGRTYCISEIDENGLVVLDVSEDIDRRFGGFMNDLRLEAKYLTPEFA